MTICVNCGLDFGLCICDNVEVFFQDVKNVPKSKCLACWFEDCRCKKGLENKKN